MYYTGMSGGNQFFPVGLQVWKRKLYAQIKRPLP